MIITREQTAVRFNIFSMTLSAADIQARTGLTPDESWKIGDARGAFGAVEKQHGFVLKSKVRASESLNDHIREMLKRLAPCAQKIGALAADAKIELSCQIHRKLAPALKFERDDLRWLGVMGARLDIDVYILAEPQKSGRRAGKAGRAGGQGGQGDGPDRRRRRARRPRASDARLPAYFGTLTPSISGCIGKARRMRSISFLTSRTAARSRVALLSAPMTCHCAHQALVRARTAWRAFTQ